MMKLLVFVASAAQLDESCKVVGDNMVCCDDYMSFICHRSIPPYDQFARVYPSTKSVEVVNCTYVLPLLFLRNFDILTLRLSWNCPPEIPNQDFFSDVTTLIYESSDDPASWNRTLPCRVVSSPILRVLGLSGLKISAVSNTSWGQLPSVEELDLSKNWISNVEEMFVFPSLRVLNLKSNRISSILAFASKDSLPNLEELNLSFNALTSFPTLTNLPKLRLVRLKGNQITSVSDGIKYMSSLVELDLSDNKLEKLPTFPYLPKLRVLNLGGNGITFFSEDTFKHLSGLEELLLWNNKLEKLPTFPYLPKLRIIHLGGNGITLLSEDTFRHLPGLETLSLLYNKLEKVPTFPYLPKLRDLNVAACEITSLSPDTFKHLPNLRNLGLYNNKLAILEPSTFTYLPRLDSVQLQNNPLRTLPDDGFCCNPELFKGTESCFYGVGMNDVRLKYPELKCHCPDRTSITCPEVCTGAIIMTNTTSFRQLLPDIPQDSRLFKGIGIKGVGISKCITADEASFVEDGPTYLVAKMLPCDPLNPSQHLWVEKSHCGKGWTIRHANLYLYLEGGILYFGSFDCDQNFVLDDANYVKFGGQYLLVATQNNNEILTAHRGRSVRTKFVSVQRLSEMDRHFNEVSYTAKENTASQEFWTLGKMKFAEFLPNGTKESPGGKDCEAPMKCQSPLSLGTLYSRRNLADNTGLKCVASVVRGNSAQLKMYGANSMMVMTSGRCVATDGDFHRNLLFVSSSNTRWHVSYAYTFEYDAERATVAFLYMKKNAKNQAIADVERHLGLKFGMSLVDENRPAATSFSRTAPDPISCSMPSTWSTAYPGILIMPNPYSVLEWEAFGATSDTAQVSGFRAVPFDDTVRIAYAKIVGVLDGDERLFCSHTVSPLH